MKIQINKLILLASMLFLISCEQKNNIPQTESIDSSSVFADLPGNKVSNIGIKYFRQTKESLKIGILTTPEIHQCGSELPTHINELLSGTKYFYYKFDKSTQAEASAMGFSGAFGKKDLLIIRDFIRYKKIKCDQKTKYVGIGLRCFIQIKSYTAKLGGSLSGIAASVEQGKAEAVFSIESIGFPIEGRDIAGLVTQGDYDVDNFASLAILHSRILEKLNSDNIMTIDPAEFPIDKAQEKPF